MKISLVVPVFNEEKTIPIFYEAVRDFGPLAEYDVEIVFVDDGSQDKTAEIVANITARDPLAVFLQLTRNFGKESALLCGLEYATGDAVIPIDADMQDPIEVIPEMLERWRDGADVVLAKRVDRTSDSFLKRVAAGAFYRVHNQLSASKIQENVGDFRLMSRATLEHVKAMPERNLFMKGILSWVGGKTAVVEYRRVPRAAGTTKFNGWKLWNLGIEGITSFSTVPLRIWTYLGLSISFGSIIYAFWMVIDKLVFGNPVAGYPSLITAIMFLGGIQIIGIGVIGEYVGRIYIETKQRPRYLLRGQTMPGSASRNPALNSEKKTDPSPRKRETSSEEEGTGTP